MSKRTIGLLVAALLVLVVGALTFSLSQVLATRLTPTSVPTRTPRPTWTRGPSGFVVASPTLDVTRFPSTPAAVPTPQLIVPGQSQSLVVPQGNGAPGGVLTVVVVIVTATPPPVVGGTPPAPGAAALPPGANPAPQAPVPGPPAALPTVTPTPAQPVLVMVKEDQVYVRQGPGTVYPPVTQLDMGTAITVVGRNRAGDWWKICCVNNSDVWIADAMVTVTGPLWTVPEVTNIPPTPVPTATPAPTPTIAPTPTFAWPFHLEGTPQQYPLSQNYFSIGAVIYNGATPLYGYKLRIRKLSTGQEWLTNGSDAFWTYEPIQWGDRHTPVIGLKRNVKWDSNGVNVPLGDDVWEVTCTDGAGNPLSTPVRFNTSAANAQWYYVVFSSSR